jgi:hypothetical protein
MELTLAQQQTNLFNQLGAFFAFSKGQFSEKQKENTTYVNMGAGLICPKENASQLIDSLEKLSNESIRLDLANNTIEEIIHRELANHEAQVTGDISDTVDALDGYPITAEQVQAEYSVFFQKCIDNDWF